MKKYVILVFLLFSQALLFSLDNNTPIGGKATGLGGMDLDIDLGSFNVFYNPTLIAFQDIKGQTIEAGVSGSASPYGLQGINNFSFAGSFFMPLNDFKVGAFFGMKSRRVENGISENEYDISLASAHKTFLKNVVVGGSLRFKLLQNKLMVDISGFSPSAMAFNVDSDFSFDINQGQFRLGVTGINLIVGQKLAYLSDAKVNTLPVALIAHGKARINQYLDFIMSYNFLGSTHLVDKSNFFYSSVAFANMNLGFEANFSGVLFVRLGINQANLTGGIGLKAKNMDIDLGVMPQSSLGLYYQLSVNYKFNIENSRKR